MIGGFIGKPIGGVVSSSNVQTLFPSLFVDADTFYTHVLTPGPVTLRPSLFTDADTFYTPKLNLTIRPSLFVDGDTFYVPVILAGLLPPLLVDPDIFYSPEVSREFSPGFKFNREWRLKGGSLPVYKTLRFRR